MFTTAEERTHFSESHVYGMLSPEINRPAFHVQIVLASVPLSGQHPTPQERAADPALPSPCLPFSEIIPRLQEGCPQPGSLLQQQNATFLISSPALPRDISPRQTGTCSVWMYTELRDWPPSHRAAADLSTGLALCRQAV